MSKLVTRCIDIYRRINAVLVAMRFPLVSFSGCRSVPSCSEYAMHMVQTRGVCIGLSKACLRVLTCNPLPHRVQ